MEAEGVELLFGPMLIGVFLNCVLYGVMVVQTYIYFQRYKGDPRWFKIFVFYLLFCETVNVVCDIAVVYEPLVVRYGTLRAVTITPIMLAADGALTVMISTPVQLFIAWRVKIMSRSSIVPAIISFFAITSFIGGVATTVSVAIFNEYAHFHKNNGAAITWLASSAAADIIITASLVYNLLGQRTGFAATDNLINKIIRLTVQTGLITSVSALLDVTLPAVASNTNLNFIWDFALSKLYSNSLLSTLNARRSWKVTSSFRDNVLFGNEIGVESMARSRTQIVIDSHVHTGRPTSMVHMKVFDSAVGYHQEDRASATDISHKVSDDSTLRHPGPTLLAHHRSSLGQ